MEESFNFLDSIRSRSRQTSVIWLCNIGAEKYWHRLPVSVIDRNEECVVNRVEEIGLLLCRRQDIMILRRKPDAFFLDLLAEYGFEVPGILCPSNPDDVTPISELLQDDTAFHAKMKQLAGIMGNPVFLPYGVTLLEEKLAAGWEIPIAGPSANIHALVNDKIRIRLLASEYGFKLPEGDICHSPEDIINSFNKLTGPGFHFQQVIIKEPHNASGKGLYIVGSQDELSKTVERLKRCSRKLENPAWITEGWYRKQADINYQVYISPRGESSLFSIKQQLLDGVVYTGSRYPARLKRSMAEQYNQFSRETGRLLFQVGYHGVAGIDSIITDKGEIFPLIEVNGRFTLSTYISFIQQNLGEDLLYITRYYRVITAKKLDYKDIYALLVRAGIQYDPAKKEGIFIFNSAALPVHPLGDSGRFNGRIFALILGRDWQQVDRNRQKLGELLKENTMHFH